MMTDSDQSELRFFSGASLMFSAQWENLCFLCASVFQIPKNKILTAFPRDEPTLFDGDSYRRIATQAKV